MIGKSLTVLLQELSKPQRHLLSNICKKSSDKRHHSLYVLLRLSSAAKYDFDKALVKSCQNLIKGKNQHEKEKTIRRFIDFATKEIENIQIKYFLSSNLSERNYLLGKIFFLDNNPMLSEFYFNKAVSYNTITFLAEKKEQQLQTLLNNVSISDHKKSINALKALVLEKNELIQKTYHSSLSGIYERLSFLAMEDNSIVHEMKELILTQEEINQLVTVCANTIEEFRYRLARLRFAFYEPDFNKKTSHIIRMLNKSKLKPDDKKHIHHQVKYLRMLYDFNNGVTANKIDFVSNKQSSEQQKFYHYLIELLAQFEKNQKIISALPRLKFSAVNFHLALFLELLENFLNGNFSKCTKAVAELAYSQHYHIMAWSKLLEIKIHLLKKNYDYCDSLITRYKRFLKQNENKKFTAASNHTCFRILTEMYKNQNTNTSYNKSYSSLTSLHRAIIIKH